MEGSVQEVKSFKLLGSVMTWNSTRMEEIRAGYLWSREVFKHKMKALLTVTKDVN